MKDFSCQFSFFYKDSDEVAFVAKRALDELGKSPVVIVRLPNCFAVGAVECLIHEFTSHALIAGYVFVVDRVMGSFVETVFIAWT